MSRRLIVTLMIAGLLAACVSSKSPLQADIRASSIPFELDHGHMFVDAVVNGKGPYRFGFDTGASGMGRADSKLASALALPPAGEAATSDGIKTATANVVSVDRLRVGNIEQRKVTLLSRDYNQGRKPDQKPIEGIIARDFFADKLVTIDYPARRLTFARGALDAKSAGVVPYGASFAIKVCFASGCYPGKIDTGSSRGIVIPKELAGKVSASAPTLIGQAKRTNSVSSLYEMQLREPVQVAGVTATAQNVLYADPSDAVINVGSDFLKDYVLTIDQQHHLLKISRP